MSNPKVSVIIPIRNEQKYISTCLNSLLTQTYPLDSYEVIVVDGRSSDSSKALVERYSRENPNVRCLENPAGIVPCGMNIGIRNSEADIIIRADGHTAYPSGYIENCVRHLEETGADNVGGPCLTVPENQDFGARMVVAILTSPFGVGDSKFRVGSSDGFVETVPFGAFRRDLFDRIGLYNEKLVRNQDNELNARIRRAGGKIYQTSALTTRYHPVSQFTELLKVTFKNSQWHLFSISENGRAMSARHLIPGLFVGVVTAFVFGAAFSQVALTLLSIVLGMYLSTGVLAALLQSRKHGWGIVAAFPFASLLFHFSYGLGTLVGARYLFRSPSSSPIRAGLPTT